MDNDFIFKGSMSLENLFIKMHCVTKWHGDLAYIFL